MSTSSSRRAFTLIELMVSVVLAAMVTASLYQLFTVQSRQLAFLDLQAEMHQNLRFATDTIGRTIRVAGLGTGPAVSGELGWSGTAVNVNLTLPPILSYNSRTGGSGTDAITIVHMDPALEMETDFLRPAACGTDSISFDLALHNYATLIQSYEPGEYLLCFDYANYFQMNSYLWVITDVQTGAGIIHVSPNNQTDFVGACTTDLPSIMSCSKGEVITFYVDNDVNDGIGPGSADHPVLMMDLDFNWPEGDDVPLVDDIEDIQFSYCIADTNCLLAGSWSSTITNTQITWLVRMSVVARSSRTEFRDKYESVPYPVEDHNPGTTRDHFYRELLTTTVAPRNLRYYSNLF